MRRKSFLDQECPIARSLERVGEWWSMLILREALQGATRFEQFLKALGIAPGMLSRRLKDLVDAGLLDKQPTAPGRYDYVLTQRGQDFEPVLIALFAWGNTHFTPAGRSVRLVDAETGADIEPVFIDRASGRPLSDPGFKFAPGPAASEAMVRRLAGPPRGPEIRPPVAKTRAGRRAAST